MFLDDKTTITKRYYASFSLLVIMLHTFIVINWMRAHFKARVLHIKLRPYLLLQLMLLLLLLRLIYDFYNPRYWHVADKHGFAFRRIYVRSFIGTS